MVWCCVVWCGSVVVVSRPSAADVVICAFWAFGPHPLILSFLSLPFPFEGKNKDHTLITKHLYIFFSHYASLSLYLTHNFCFNFKSNAYNRPRQPHIYMHPPPFFSSGLFCICISDRCLMKERSWEMINGAFIACLLLTLLALPYLTLP